MLFYCSECGKESTEFSGLSHEDCPSCKVITVGHNIRTKSVPRQECLNYQTQKARLRELRALAKRPCAALVFPREQSGCGNNEDLCAACGAREELAEINRRGEQLILDRAIRSDLGNDGPPPVTCPNECAYCGEPCDGEYCSEEHAEHRSMY